MQHSLLIWFACDNVFLFWLIACDTTELLYCMAPALAAWYHQRILWVGGEVFHSPIPHTGVRLPSESILEISKLQTRTPLSNWLTIHLHRNVNLLMFGWDGDLCSFRCGGYSHFSHGNCVKVSSSGGKKGAGHSAPNEDVSLCSKW